MSSNMLKDAEFENQIRSMTDRQLSEFTARQTAIVCENVEKHEKRIKILEAVDRRMILIGSGVGVAGVGIAEAVIRVVKIITEGG